MGVRLGTVGAALLAAASLALPASTTASDSMVVQPDGKIILAGGTESRARTGGAMVQLNPDGSLDTSFAFAGGLVDFRTGSPFGPVAVAGSTLGSAGAPRDGRIIAASGSPQGGEEGFRLWGFELDGGLAATFGEAGFAATPSLEPGWGSSPVAVVPRSDGRIVVGGTAEIAFVKAGRRSMGGAQALDADGAPGETIGRIDTPGTHELRRATLSDLLERPDGSLIALGLSETLAGLQDLVLGRFVAGSGVPYDPSFAGGGGLALYNPYPSSVRPGYRANAVVSTGGRLVVVGTGSNRFFLAGFDEQGVLDTSFGENGFTTPELEGAHFHEATAAVVQPDGRIVAAGKTYNPCGTGPECWSLVVGRFLPDGALDMSFGSGGFTRVPLSYDTTTEPSLIDVALTAAGGILVSDTSPRVPQGRFTVARLHPDGGLDPSFGVRGIATAAPCDGALVALRRSGCLSSARVRLRTRALRRRRPGIHLRVSASQPLDPLARVTLILPRGVTVKRPRSLSRRATVRGNGGRPVSAIPKRISVSSDEFPRPTTISLTLPRGVVERIGHRRRGRKLAFRVRVWFQDGSKQTIVVRRRG